MNLNLLIDYFNGLENRVTAVHIGESEYAELFRQSTKAQENISILFVQKREDIPKIVLGQIGGYFNSSSGI